MGAYEIVAIALAIASVFNTSAQLFAYCLEKREERQRANIEHEERMLLLSELKWIAESGNPLLLKTFGAAAGTIGVTSPEVKSFKPRSSSGISTPSAEVSGGKRKEDKEAS